MTNPAPSRRAIVAASAAAALAPSPAAGFDAAVVARHDQAIENYLKLQVTDPASRWHGGFRDAFGLHNPGTAAGSLDLFISAFVTAASRFHRSRDLVERMRLSAAHLGRAQNEFGNFNLLISNFNSPPDTAFIMRAAAAAARHARRNGERELVGLMEPILRKGAGALVAGGMHTPNHRWVACAALSQLYELLGDAACLRRAEQWLAEGIDIDEDGQYSERSTLVYNPVVNSALIVTAEKLNRPELLDPVRRNLNSLLYLLHPGNEVVTEISRRQDLYQRGKPNASWFALRYLAVRDGNGQFATLAGALDPSLSLLLEYPSLSQAGPTPTPLPDDYEKLFPAVGLARIRRGASSATLMLDGNSRFFSVRRGDAVINAVRFASAFFGKAQFVPQRWEKRRDGYHFSQSLDAAYYQPFDPPRRVPASEHLWYTTRPGRRRTEVCRLEQSAMVAETRQGFRLRLQAGGTDGVPVAVEINLREGGKLDGCVAAPQMPDAWILPSGKATYRVASDTIRFGPGIAEHAYTQVRGAEAKLAGPSVYMCGFTPFDHTIEIELTG